MDPYTYTSLISNLGFPIVVSLYLLYIMQKSMKGLMTGLQEVSKQLATLTNTIETLCTCTIIKPKITTDK